MCGVGIRVRFGGFGELSGKSSLAVTGADDAIGHTGNEGEKLDLEQVPRRGPFDGNGSDHDMRPVFHEVVCNRGGRNGFAVRKHLLRRHTEAGEEPGRITALILQQAFVRNRIKGDHGPGGNREDGSSVRAGKKAPADGVCGGGNVIGGAGMERGWRGSGGCRGARSVIRDRC